MNTNKKSMVEDFKTEKERLEFLGIKQKLVILTGAGISAESGIQTFRGLADGLWYDHDPNEVATIVGWRKDPQKVLNFYNTRRADLANVQPNDGHIGLVELEDLYDVVVITQNVDDLHEKAGSSNIIHLHGKLNEMKGSDMEIEPYDKDIKIGDKSQSGAQYRPNVVWFGEQVPLMTKACKEAYSADIFVVIGTSLEVYPAASLIFETKMTTPIYLIDPGEVEIGWMDFNTEYERLSIKEKIIHIKEPASSGVYKLIKMLKESN